MATSNDIGKELEEAVGAIETMILRSFPEYREDTFVIQTRKVVTVGGVRHEIDIWVEIDLGKEYKSVFIFECKNWKAKVSKNEVIVFSEKVKVVQAQRGFFIARSFTKDARSQARKDLRTELLLAKKHDPGGVIVPFDFHVINREKTDVMVTVYERGIGPDAPHQCQPIDISPAEVALHGQSLDLSAYVQDWASQVADEREKHFPSGTLPEGTYNLEATEERHYAPKQFVLNGRDIERVVLKVSFRVRLVRPPVVSDYEVETRGRILSLAPIQLDAGGVLQAGFIAIAR